MPKPTLTVLNPNATIGQIGGKLTVPSAKLTETAIETFKDKFSIPDKFGLGNSALANAEGAILQMNPIMRSYTIAKPFMDIFVFANQLLQDYWLYEIKKKLDECLGECDKYEFKNISLPYIKENVNPETGEKTSEKKIAKFKIQVKKPDTIPNPLNQPEPNWEELFQQNYEYALIGYNDPLPIYGIPIANYQDSVAYKPQIQFHFKQISGITGKPIATRISFRMMIPPSTEAALKTMANKIKTTLKDAKYTTGTQLYSYTDTELGYRFKISCNSESKAKEIIGLVLGIQDHTFKDACFSLAKPKPLKVGETVTILEQQVKLPDQNKAGEVIFYKAEYHVKGIEPKLMVNIYRPKQSLANPD